jgi:predicted small secreted protein
MNPKELSMRKHLTIFFLNLVLLSGAAALLSACNTTAGVGQDISATGKAITSGAEQSKPR